MIPQLGFAEMIVLLLLAIIVVGPKDLPKLMRTIGRGMSKIRGLANEFKMAFEDMDTDGEMADLRREIAELKEMGKLSNLSDAAMAEDLQNLDADLRAATDVGASSKTSVPKAPSSKAPSPKTPAPKPDAS